MAKLSEIRYFLFVSLMICPTRTLEVFLANAKGDYNIHTEINVTLKNGVKMYAGRSSHNPYIITRKYTHRVVLYIVSPERFCEIMRTEFRDERMAISKELYKGFNRYELFYMAIKDFQKNKDEPIIRDFIRDTIKQHTPNPLDTTYKFNTIGNINLEVTYVTPELLELNEFKKYTEKFKVFQEKLEDHLEAIKIEDKEKIQPPLCDPQSNFENS